MRAGWQRRLWTLIGAVAVLVSASAVWAAEEPKRGGTAIVVIGADPAILNPNVTVGAPDVLTGCMLYDGLVRFAEGSYCAIVGQVMGNRARRPDLYLSPRHRQLERWQTG